MIYGQTIKYYFVQLDLMNNSELMNDYQLGAAACNGFPASPGASQGATQSSLERAPSFFGMSVNITEPDSSGLLYIGGSHSDSLQSAYPINDVSVKVAFPGLCFDHVKSAEAGPLLPRELALPNRAGELSAPPDQCDQTVVANVAGTGTSRVSDVAPNALMPVVRVGAEVLRVGRGKGRKGASPMPNSKLYYGNVSKSRLKMIAELESGISPPLRQRLWDDSREYLPTEEEKFNAIVKYLNNRQWDPLVAMYGVKVLAGYIISGRYFFVSGVERLSFNGIKRDAMKSYAFFKRRKMDDAYVELLRWVNKLESISAPDLKD